MIIICKKPISVLPIVINTDKEIIHPLENKILKNKKGDNR